MPPTIYCAQSARPGKSRNNLPNSRASVHAPHIQSLAARSIACFVILGITYTFVFLGTAAVPDLGLKLIGSCVLFLLTFHLALIGHDAGHGSLTHSAECNRWIGRLALLASYTPLSSWLANHNALHHAFTNLRGKDRLFAPLSKVEYDALSTVQCGLQRFYRTILGVAIYNLWFGWSNLLFPDPSVLAHIPRRTVFCVERCAVFGFLALQVVGLLAWQQYLEQTWEIPTAPVSGLVATILAPYLIMNWWTGLMGFLHHTHPLVRWYADLAEWRHAQAGVECTVHLIAPWPIDWLLGNSLEHTAHHVAPKARNGELSSIQVHLETAFPEAIQIVRLTDCLRILAFCKLYDYHEHRWLDYYGKPMRDDESNPETLDLRR